MAETPVGSGKSPHAFMVEALGVQSRLVEQRRTLIAAALAAERDALERGTGYASADVDAYFEARSTRHATRSPDEKKWRK